MDDDVRQILERPGGQEEAKRGKTASTLCGAATANQIEFCTKAEGRLPGSMEPWQ